ncbi:MAG: hypothetical protein M3177_06940 [Pseudomonadota bacterium]|nr:hypothetical protein [Pseudomonadota bacterium]
MRVQEAAAVRRILSQPDRALEYGAAKLAFDKLVDPAADVGAAMAELDRLAGIAAAMAGPAASEGAKLGAIRNLIYESGPWNGHRPFAYNHDRPLGDHLPDKLLHNCLATARAVRLDADPLPGAGGEARRRDAPRQRPPTTCSCATRTGSAAGSTSKRPAAATRRVVVLISRRLNGLNEKEMR